MHRLRPKLQWVLFSGLVIFYLGCDAKADTKSEEEEEEVEPAIPVEVKPVEKGEIAAHFTGPLTLGTEQDAVVAAKVGGLVEEILVEEGDIVAAGQLLARLEDDQAALRLVQAEATLRKMERDFTRKGELFAKNLVSAEIHERAQFEFEAQKAAYELAKLNLAYTGIRAPIAGVVAERMIKVGNMVPVNAPTFRIMGADPLLAVLYVPELEISKLAVGQAAELKVDALPGRSFHGRLERISPVVDPATGTVKVTCEVSNADRSLKPGMFGRINIVYDVHKNTLLLPKESILAEDRETTVFIIRDSLAHRQIVALGYSSTTHVEVLAGLTAGELVVTTGQASLKDSARIEVVEP